MHDRNSDNAPSSQLGAHFAIVSFLAGVIAVYVLGTEGRYSRHGSEYGLPLFLFLCGLAGIVSGGFTFVRTRGKIRGEK
jgi:hypothetical protein